MYERRKRVEESCDISTLSPEVVDYESLVKAIVTTAIHDAERYPIPFYKKYRKSVFKKRTYLFKVLFKFLRKILKEMPKSTIFILIILEYIQFFVEYLRRGWNIFDERMSITARDFLKSDNDLLGLYCDHMDYEKSFFLLHVNGYLRKIDKKKLDNELFLFEEHLLQYQYE